MDLIRPPTDNLYKFVAISGLLMYGFGTWLDVTHGQALELQGQELEAGSDRLEFDQELIGERLDRFGERTAELRAEMEDDGLARPRLDSIRSELRDRDGMLPTITEELRVASLESRIRIRRYEGVESAYKRARRAALLMELVGGLAALWGFRRWYERVQKHEDARLAHWAREEGLGDEVSPDGAEA